MGPAPVQRSLHLRQVPPLSATNITGEALVELTGLGADVVSDMSHKQGGGGRLFCVHQNEGFIKHNNVPVNQLLI